MSPELQRAVDRLVAAIGRHDPPLTVAIDGPSGAGKSTIAALAAPRVDGTLVSTDDFYAATIPDADWEARSPAQRAADVVDWRRLRTEVIEPLRAGRTTRWRAFDFAAGPRPDGTFGFMRTETIAHPGPVLILEGGYSARPELADLVDLVVLVIATPAVCRVRLADREPTDVLAAWHAQWDAAEAHYFGRVCPPETFDLILRTDGPADS